MIIKDKCILRAQHDASGRSEAECVAGTFSTLLREPLAMPDFSDLSDVPLPTSLIAPQSGLTIAARTCLLEGPAFDGDGNLFFSDIVGNQIYRMTPERVLSIFRADSGRTNGNTFDAQGRLISCEGVEFGPGGRRRLVRTDLKTGHVEVLTDRFEGNRYNSPNDVVVDTFGRIWFTDPFYGEDRSALEMEAEAVYRIDPDGTVARVLSQPAIERPNGLAITPSGETLYVVDSHTRPNGHRKIWSFDVGTNGELTGQRSSLTLAGAEAATGCDWTNAATCG